MRILVDELPEWPEKCPFHIYDYDIHENVCRLSHGEAYVCRNTDDCPFLKELKEKKNV